MRETTELIKQIRAIKSNHGVPSLKKIEAIMSEKPNGINIRDAMPNLLLRLSLSSLILTESNFFTAFAKSSSVTYGLLTVFLLEKRR